MRKYKYLFIYSVPGCVALSFLIGGIVSFLPILVFFILIPLIELMLKADFSNMDATEKELAAKDPFYDLLLYSLVPIQVAFLIWYLNIISMDLPWIEIIGKTASMGIMCGIIGINLGHELGHREKSFEQLLGDVLLLTSLENHFVPYHNRGHHNDVATPKDPATARLGEPIFLFWFRSHVGSYLKAWKIEFERMRIRKKSLFSLHNKMIVYTLAAIGVFVSIFYFYSIYHVFFFLIVSTVGILLLETVNYIEHYGLLRKQREDGSYERVRRTHSWNSNHIIGRVILFELSRHSDHHYKPDKHYQLLESFDESPQMPTGYPGMMMLSLVPPLFFRVMNPKVKELRND
jgi:alkane 1-monooxygenase